MTSFGIPILLREPLFLPKNSHFMKKLLILIAFFMATNAFSQSTASNFITSDIDNFWVAFDKITATKDSAEQYGFIKTLYLDKATVGLKAMMQARQYTAKSYVNAIKKYPLYWASVRANTLKAPILAKQIEAGVKKLKRIYPDLKPAKVYFTIGVFRANGTTMDSMVLIGAELAMADKNTVTSELTKQYSHLLPYFKENPIENIVFLNVHEFVHTQQKSTIGHDLLTQSVMEGVAEFLAVKAMGIPSTAPAIDFGKKNEPAVKTAFAKDMLALNFDNWLWNDAENAFKMRDLAYYVGYAIAEKNYNAAKNKSKAIKEMIELDYNNEPVLDKFVDKSGYFPEKMATYRTAFDAQRPTIVGIKEFKNGDTNVDANIKQLTIEFSTKMDKDARGFELGPLGDKNLIKIKKFIGFSEDGKSISLEIELTPNLRQQLELSPRFMSETGIPIKPYLIDITTK
jgi:hypothetical protein